ncbi:MAG: TIGR02757 family protein [Thermodesulforhabdaceae bacterium]
MKTERISEVLALIPRVYRVYHHREFIGFDPVGFLQLYANKEDREIVALVAALLAFGRVEQIHQKVGKILELMVPSPRIWVERFKSSKWQHINFCHRFVKRNDLFGLFEGMKNIINVWGSLEACFGECWTKSESNLSKAVSLFRAILIGNNGGLKNHMLLPDPSKKSPCKRWMLFLRWMVRCDEIDPGGWKCPAPKDLIVPVDVHMERVARRLELSKHRTIDWVMAVEITETLKLLDPEDPVKYDFSLTRWSMDGFPELE